MFKPFLINYTQKDHLKNCFEKLFSLWILHQMHGRRLDAILFGNASTVDRWQNTHLSSFPLRTGNAFSR